MRYIFEKISLFITSTAKNEKLYNVLSWLIIALLAAIFLINSEMLLLNFDDVSYHLLTAQGFAQSEGLTLWENWESLPLGRAHIYPPFYHLLLTPLVSLGLPSLLILQIASFTAIIGLLILSWWALKKLFNTRLAFIYLLFITLDVGMINMLAITTPASIVILLSPLLLLLIKNNKLTAALLLMTLFWYTHMMFPYLIIAALIFWSLFNRSYFKAVIKVSFFSYLLFSPWLLQIIANANYLRYFHPSWPGTIKEAVFMDINITLTVLFVLALIVIVLWWQRKSGFKNLMFFAGLIIAASPLMIIAPLRFFSSTGGWAMLIFIAYFFNQLLSKNFLSKKPASLKIKQILVFITILILINLNYRVVFDPQTRETVYYSEPNIIYQGYQFIRTGEGYPGMLLHYAYTPKNIDLAKTIQNETEPDNVILNVALFFGLRNYHPRVRLLPAQLFASLANRPMANPRYPENQWQESLPVSQATIVLADYRQTHLFSGKKTEADQKLTDTLEQNFDVLSESDRLVAFKNKNSNTFKPAPLKPIIPLWLTWLIIAGVIIYIGSETRKIAKNLQ